MDTFTSGDIWDKHTAGDWIIIPTNLGGIHGRGLAKQAYERGWIRYRNDCEFETSPFHNRIISIAVKRNWWEQCTGDNLKLIASQLKLLADFCKRHPQYNFWIPMLGMGNGRGKWSEIRPLLDKLRPFPNVNFIRYKPSANNIKYNTNEELCKHSIHKVSCTYCRPVSAPVQLPPHICRITDRQITAIVSLSYKRQRRIPVNLRYWSMDFASKYIKNLLAGFTRQRYRYTTEGLNDDEVLKLRNKERVKDPLSKLDKRFSGESYWRDGMTKPESVKQTEVQK